MWCFRANAYQAKVIRLFRSYKMLSNRSSVVLMRMKQSAAEIAVFQRAKKDVHKIIGNCVGLYDKKCVGKQAETMNFSPGVEPLSRSPESRWRSSSHGPSTWSGTKRPPIRSPVGSTVTSRKALPRDWQTLGWWQSWICNQQWWNESFDEFIEEEGENTCQKYAKLWNRYH